MWYFVILGRCGISTLDSGHATLAYNALKYAPPGLNVQGSWSQWKDQRGRFSKRRNNSLTLRAVSWKLVLWLRLWVPARLDLFIHEVTQPSSPEGSFSLTSGKNKHIFFFVDVLDVKLGWYQIYLLFGLLQSNKPTNHIVLTCWLNKHTSVSVDNTWRLDKKALFVLCHV